MGQSGMTVEDLEAKVRYLLGELSSAWLRIHALEARVDQLNAAVVAATQAPRKENEGT